MKILIRTIIFSILVPGTIGGWAPYWLAHSGLAGIVLGESMVSIVTDVHGMCFTVMGR